MSLDGRTRQTGLISADLSSDPSLAWNQLLSFEIEPQAIKDMPNMTVNVELMDKAMIGSDSKIGTCSFSLKDFALGEDVKEIVSLSCFSN